jgi:hypothetical protein
MASYIIILSGQKEKRKNGGENDEKNKWNE